VAVFGSRWRGSDQLPVLSEHGGVSPGARRIWPVLTLTPLSLFIRARATSDVLAEFDANPHLSSRQREDLLAGDYPWLGRNCQIADAFLGNDMSKC
jgi:hypothetical protein